MNSDDRFNPEEGWTKPTDKPDSTEIIIKSSKHEKVITPEKITKTINPLQYQGGDSFQIGKNGKAILNRTVPVDSLFTVYVRVIIEKK